MSLTDGIIGAMIAGGGKGGGGSVIIPNINATAQQLPAGSDPTVTKSGTQTNINFEFGIPEGEPGQPGTNGEGVPAGGTTGQVLAKATNDDYDTVWITPPSGGTSNYNDLSNQPQVNGVTLTGDKSTTDLKIIPVLDLGTITGTPPVQIQLTPEQVAQSQLDNAVTQAVYQGITLHLQKIGQSDTQVVFSGFASDSNIFLLVNIESGNATFNVVTVKGIPAGGTTGQVLAKSSDNDYQAQWVDQTEATVSVNVGTTTTGEAGTEASVTNSGTDQNVVLNFTIPKGSQGVQGVSVQSIERTSGTGAAGTYDTYTITLSNGASSQFQVYNGANGDGSGDFMANGSVPMTAPLQMGGNQIKNVATPTEETDGATKGYVDTNTYNQQEANDRFALALKTTDGPSSSLQIYPDEGSNMTITAQGFTTQEGSGDPSPTNIRPIKVGGITLVKQELNGSENWATLQTNDSNYYAMQLQVPGIATSDANTIGNVFSSAYKSVSSNDIYQTQTNGIALSQPGDSFIEIYDSNYNTSDVSSWKSYLAQNPIVVWCAMQDGSGDLYTPVITDGADYHCECLPLNEPLCENDYASSGGTEIHNSVYGQFVGTEEINAFDVLETTVRFYIKTPNIPTFGDEKSYASGVSSHLVPNGLFGLDAEHFYFRDTGAFTAIYLFLDKTRLSSISASGAQAWLSDQASNGTPFQFVMQYYPNRTFNTNPTQFLANPASDGSVTISGENTVSATYNKSIAKAIEELKDLISDQSAQ